MTPPPTRVAIANDLGERCQIIIGSWGYLLTNNSSGQPSLTFAPQKSKTRETVYVSTFDHLSMRDAEDSRVFGNDWRKGFGQIAFLVDDVVSKQRYYNSTQMVISEQGQLTIARALANQYVSTNAVGLPLVVAGSYLYLGDAGFVRFSAAWSGAPTAAAISDGSAKQVTALTQDGQYVYGCVSGLGINRWVIGSPTAGLLFSAAIATPALQPFTTAPTGGTLVSGTYAYRVSATNGAGETPASVESTVIVGGQIVAPLQLSSSPFGGASASGVLTALSTNYYRISSVNDNGESLAGTEFSYTLKTGENAVAILWSSVVGATKYKIYGRTTGSEKLIATVDNNPGITTFTDFGTTTPNGALPTANTTGSNLNVVTVRWGAVPGATGYKVYGRTSGAEQYLATVGAVTSYVDDGVRIASGAIPAGSSTAPTALTRITWANRVLYTIDATTLYSYNLLAVSNDLNGVLVSGITPNALFTLPTGWTMNDVTAKRGGTIDSPIMVMANDGGRSFIWQWDGTTIHDYLGTPNGFIGQRMKVYLGVLFISGYHLNPDGTQSPAAYYVQNDTLGFLGYFGNKVANGNPTANGTTTGYAIDAIDNTIYFALQVGTNIETWVYDMINGGLSRRQSLAASSGLDDLVIYRNGPWITALGAGLYGTQATYAATATLDTSDLHLGQPWSSNQWLALEITHSALLTGESIAVSYSIDGGTTYTAIGTVSTVGATNMQFIMSSSTSTVANPYLRLRFTLTAGAGNATTPALYSYALKADPVDPAGVHIDAYLACSDNSYMPNGAPDFQGGSGQERMYNIVNLYENQAIIQVIYMAPGQTRAKNPRTINAFILDYKIEQNASVGLTPDKGVEGLVRVELREVTL